MSLLDPEYTDDELRCNEELRSRINIANAIASARINQRLTQAQLAALAGTKQGRVSEVEGLQGNPRLDTLDRITRALGLEITVGVRAAP